MGFNYQKICADLLKDLPPREKEVILRRFGLKTGERETLETIGKYFGITRERVRQIEEVGIGKMKPKIGNYQKIFHSFIQYLKNHGGLRKEAILLEDLGSKKYQPQVYFLLSIGEKFERFGETEDFYSLWVLNQNSLDLAKKAVDSLFSKLKTTRKPLPLKKLKYSQSLSEAALSSYLEISKKIQKNSDGFFGLKDWPEINPRGVKDKAYLIFKKIGKPLHFTEVTNFIEGAQKQTVHNELIRDPRFVLVGRGIYALSEWGYFPGQVKDVISRVLKETANPLTKEEILKKVLSQRVVKKNTILLNLSNKKHFSRTPEGKYIIREI